MSEEQNIPKEEERDIPENNTAPIFSQVNDTASQIEPILSTQPKTESETPSMEVHHHPHVHHSKKWKDYLFEFFMLFLAVTAGFLMENQREHYVELQRVKQFAKSLVSDLKKDTAMLNREIRQIKGSINLIDTLSAYVYAKELKNINNFELFYKSRFEFYRPYTWSRATLEQIKNSGSLRYFNNDSIVYKISAYDAFTRHMDYDYEIDQNQKSKTTVAREQVVDMNYPGQVNELLNTSYDSLKNTTLYEEMRKVDKPLLARDINDIKVLVNQSLQLKYLLEVRERSELPELVNEATELIQLLKKEYHLN